MKTSPTLATSLDPMQLYRPSLGAVQVFDMNLIDWAPTANPGLFLKSVRHDNVNGLFLGQIQFEPLTYSGLHQHQGLATSFVAQGGLTDYHGSVGLHQAGINLRGATHDAIAYETTVLVSRLEGPVSYPPDSSVSGIHAGSRYAQFVNPDPDAPPEINVTVDGLERCATGYDGVHRQVIYDYAHQINRGRFLQLHIKPQSKVRFRTTAMIEFWVRGGNLQINAKTVTANSFIVCQPNTDLAIDCPFGALLLCWADGPEVDATAQKNLFGFIE
jgi:hypothetical protein